MNDNEMIVDMLPYIFSKSMWGVKKRNSIGNKQTAKKNKTRKQQKLSRRINRKSK